MSLKKLVAKVQKHFPNSIQVRHEIWLTAIPPLLCGYSFEPSSQRGVFRPRAIIMPTYTLEKFVFLNHSIELMPSHSSAIWWFDAKQMEPIIPDLVAKLGGPGARFLHDNGRDLRAFLAYLKGKYPPPVIDPYILLALGCGHALLGDLDTAARWLEPLLGERYSHADRDWVQAVSRQCTEAMAAVREGDAAIRRLLDGWSQETLVNLGIVRNDPG